MAGVGVSAEEISRRYLSPWPSSSMVSVMTGGALFLLNNHTNLLNSSLSPR